MKVQVRSHLHWRPELSGEHELQEPVTIKTFVENLNIAWNRDVLIVVNEQIAEENYVLQDGDRIDLLVPLVGG
ncbi:sulfur carrier protein ThiS [Caldalkalibacillus uzonensis]|uniref:Sulfur carrier protein ThiS n=1 Tax=Caldalkalibacillus uzonensis TaxID=353224 RepID=A0ABU0CNR3_9BACI|nr:MoaD/ThiS family protein [Caldalkalibacillus uzonensis]MDQ0338053.1 sulfur carrier protein ThiS [Caldalkalibacillus uzonensis]